MAPHLAAKIISALDCNDVFGATNSRAPVASYTALTFFLKKVGLAVRVILKYICDNNSVGSV